MRRFSNGVLWAALLFFAAAYFSVFLAHGSTCRWYTTLVTPGSILHTSLLKQPRIGQMIHINGNLWRVLETRRACK